MRKAIIKKIVSSFLLMAIFSVISIGALSSFATDGEGDNSWFENAKEYINTEFEEQSNRKEDGSKALNGIRDANDEFYRGLNAIIENLSKNPRDWLEGDAKRVSDSVAGTLKAVGSVLVILFYGIGVFKTTYSYVEHRQWGTTFKGLVRLGFALVFAAMAPEIAYYIFDIGTALVNTVVDAANISSHYSGADNEGWDLAKAEYGQLKLFSDGRITLALTFWLVKMGLHLLFVVMLVYVMMRFFKMMIYIAVSPIPMAALASDSTQSHAIAFIRSLAGVALEGLVIILAIKIFQVVLENSDGMALLGTSYVPFADGDSEGQRAIKAYLMNVVVNAVTCCAVVIGADKMVQKAFGT